MKSEKIVIVGGGSAGWMTASTLIKHYPGKEIILLEDPDTPTVGVGESTLGHFNDFLASLDLKDEDWMPYCNASYKNSIKFTDWKHENSGSFHYPFGGYDTSNSNFGIMDWFLLKLKNGEKWDDNHFAKVHTSVVEMCDANKYNDNADKSIPNYNPEIDTAYHLDAALFGEFLKNKFCLPRGVQYISDKYEKPIMDDHNFVHSIVTKSGMIIEGDLFIDCTGMRSLLLEGIYDVPFVSFTDTLLNDRAIATQLPYIDKEVELEPVTNSTAIESGWCWNIPLWSRIGSGYVYSSKFATEEEAEEQFKKYLTSNKMPLGDTEEGKSRVDKATFKHIKIRHGYHEQPWVNNVCAIGMSIGFIEPLESTGLLLWHEAIKMLTDSLHRPIVTKYDRQTFNVNMRHTLEGFFTFISYHYSSSMRSDTPYWWHVTQEVDYFEPTKSLIEGQLGSSDNITAAALAKLREHEYPISLGGVNYISAGMGQSPVTPHSLHRRKLTTLQSTTLDDVTLGDIVVEKGVNTHGTGTEKGVQIFEGDDLPDNIIEMIMKPVDKNKYVQILSDTEVAWEKKLAYQQQLASDSPTLYRYLKDRFYSEVDEDAIKQL